jgi:Spx/MgsR family transcriptional regulator
MLTLIGIPNCDQIRKTRAWLDDNKISYEFADLKKEPLTRNEIAELASKVYFDTLINKKGTTWRNLGIGNLELNNEQMLDLIEKHQTVMKRPILVDQEGNVMVGFDEDALARFVEDAKE